MNEQFTLETADYQRMYVTLFNQITVALDAMQRRDYGTAETILQNAQIQTEELYIEMK